MEPQPGDTAQDTYARVQEAARKAPDDPMAQALAMMAQWIATMGVTIEKLEARIDRLEKPHDQR